MILLLNNFAVRKKKEGIGVVRGGEIRSSFSSSFNALNSLLEKKKETNRVREKKQRSGAYPKIFGRKNASSMGKGAERRAKKMGGSVILFHAGEFLPFEEKKKKEEKEERGGGS